MDIEDIRSDLQALRKLYGLLKNNGYSLPNESSDSLDYKARLLLRNLLDAATERIFKVHAENLAVRHGSFDTVSSTQKEQFKEMLKLQPPSFLTNVSNNFGSVVQNTSKDLSTHKAVLEKDEWLSSKSASQVVSSEQSRLKIFSSEPQAIKKRCRVCQRTRAKQLKSSEEPKVMEWGIPNPDKSIGVPHQLHNLPFQFRQGDLLEKGPMPSNKAIQTDNVIETQRRIWSFESQSNQSEIGPSACSSNKPVAGIVGSGAIQDLAAEVVKKPEETDQISKEASAKIQQIESRITDLQVAAKPANPLQIQNGAQYGWHDPMSSSGPGTESASSMMQKKRQLARKNEPSDVGDFVVGRNESESRPIRQRIWEPTQWHQVPNQFREIKMPTQAINRTLKPLPPIRAMLSETPSQNVRRNKGNAFEYDRLSEIGKPTERYKLPSQNESQVPGKIVKAIVGRIESLSEVRSQDDHMSTQTKKFVQGLRVPPTGNKMAKMNLPLPAKLQSLLDTEVFDQSRTGLKKTIGSVGTSQPSWSSVGSKLLVRHNTKPQAVDAGSELSRTRTRTKAETRIPHRKITKQNLLDHKPTQHRVSPSLYDNQWKKDQGRPTQHRVSPSLYDYQWKKDQGSVQKKNNQLGPQRLISTSQKVSQSTSSRSGYTSSWTSQQVSNSFSDDEGYSESGDTRTRQSSGPSTSIESELYSRQRETAGHKVSCTSSDGEMYSVSSRTRRRQWDSDSSSESQDYLSSDQTPVGRHIGPSYQSVGSTSIRRMNPAMSQRLDKKQQIGRLKKLKDKLAIIFHHHHHHHHHHHNDDIHSERQVEVRGGKSLWKHAGRIFDRRSKDEVYGEQAVKKTRKSAVADKNQRGHFQVLVEGLLQHLRHTKKSKPSKGGIGLPGNGGKKAVKKLHWWQMLRRRQRGLKMPKKPRGKLGMGRKNPKLKALPKPR